MKLGTSLLVGAAGLAVGALTYAHRIELNRIDVQEIPVPLRQLDPAFDGYTIAQISDIHMGGSMTPARLAAAIEVVNRYEPDVIAITGDFATRRLPLNVSDLITPLCQLRAKDALFAVLGNHDYRNARAAVRLAIRSTELTPLHNAVQTIRRGDAVLHFAGVESVILHRARLDRVLDMLPADGPAILLAHEPDFALVAAATRRFALQLSGHSHGGQVRLPFTAKFVLPSFARRYVMGLYRVGTMQLYVNRGLGTVGIPFRFNCPPEITILRLSAR
ncbi:MAG: metallophosphoesterase [Anaerolineae bacterium]|nr:metallophosphoesterase [Anaerolineae bacterium]